MLLWCRVRYFSNTMIALAVVTPPKTVVTASLVGRNDRNRLIGQNWCEPLRRLCDNVFARNRRANRDDRAPSSTTSAAPIRFPRRLHNRRRTQCTNRKSPRHRKRWSLSECSIHAQNTESKLSIVGSDHSRQPLTFTHPTIDFDSPEVRFVTTEHGHNTADLFLQNLSRLWNIPLPILVFIESLTLIEPIPASKVLAKHEITHRIILFNCYHISGWQS